MVLLSKLPMIWRQENGLQGTLVLVFCVKRGFHTSLVLLDEGFL